jgi:predicted dehydrogenase
MSNKRSYNAIIVGAGRIGCTFDTPRSASVLTHAHAYAASRRTRLAGIVDTNGRRAEAAARVWSCAPYTNLHAALEREHPDLVSVCTPDLTHGAVLKQIAESRCHPRLVICEKPVTSHPQETRHLLPLYHRKGILLLVNHTRRFDRTVVEEKEAFARGRYGKALFGWATYGKGILHSGSHIIDLARYFFGEAISSEALFKRNDCGRSADRTVGAFLTFTSCPQFYLMAGDASRYDYFQFDIVCEKARVSFFDLGFRYSIQRVIADPVYAGYRVLAKPAVKRTHFSVAMKELADHAAACVEGKAALRCDGEDALKTQSVCWNLLHQHL